MAHWSSATGPLRQRPAVVLAGTRGGLRVLSWKTSRIIADVPSIEGGVRLGPYLRFASL